MPNIFDANGLQVRTREELEAFWTAQYQAIYGADINLAPDTPDGQMMQLKIQDTLDLQDLLVSINSSFDPDQAVGIILDQRVAINGVQRQGGTFTETDVTITNTASVNLFGIDQATFDAAGAQLTGEPIYTVADNEGNQFYLMVTQLGLPAGAHVLAFRAAAPGQVLTIPNTINVPITSVLGVSVINNPTTFTTLGENEETDGALKVRRQRAVSSAAQGFTPALIAALENLTGMTSAFVYENNTSVTDSQGVPGHSIWVITAGNTPDADIANTIYEKRNEGVGLFGETSYVVTEPQGTPFVIFWDEALVRVLFIQLTLTPINGVTPINYQGILDQLPALLVAQPNETVNTTEIGTFVQQIDPNANVTDPGLSSAELQHFALSGVPASGTFKINYNGEETTALNFSDSAATIQTALELLTGLSGVVVTGSLAAQLLNFDLSAVEDGPQALLFVTANTLQTGALVDVDFTYDEDYTALLTPASVRYQFSTSADSIVLLPILLSPATATVETAGTLQFTALGGYRDPTFTVVTTIGSTIHPVTGAYIAGGSAGTDTVRAEDGLGNFATSTVTVV